MWRWEHLRAFGNSPLVRLTVVVPLVGYLILLSGQLAAWLEIDSRLGVLAPSYPWRLVLTYVGLTLIALGSAVYAIRCPRVVRLYADPIEYNAAEHDYWASRKFIQSKIQSVAEVQAARVEQMRPSGARHRVTYTSGVGNIVNSAELTTALTVEWHLANTSRWLGQMTSGVLFGFGTLVLAVPTLWTFAEVSASAGRAILRLFAGG